MDKFRRYMRSLIPKSLLPTTYDIKSYQEIFGSEALRGERIHWTLNWVFYTILFCFCLSVYYIQDNKAGLIGLFLALINLIYNGFLSYFIILKRSVHWAGYVTLTLNILSLTVYTFVDAANNSAVIPASTAALLLYPIIIFLAALRMDKYLVIYTTILSILSMDGLYLYFYEDVNRTVYNSNISIDILSQGYRTVYLIIIGYLINSVPRSMWRILKKQELLIQESTLHQDKAEHDPLTGLYNRLYFEQQILHCEQMANAFGYSYSLLFIDLDDFKLINDTYGHDLGDFVLKSISDDLTKAVREGDLVARYGGDEFVIILNQTSEITEINSYVEMVTQAIARPRTDQGITMTIHASIGIANYPEDADTMKDLIKQADKAMYSVKKSSKDDSQLIPEEFEKE